MRRLFIVGVIALGLLGALPASSSAHPGAHVQTFGGCLHNFGVPGSGGGSVKAFQGGAGPLTSVSNPAGERIIIPPGQLEQMDPSGFLCAATVSPSP
jgi:hypothetical protein